MPSIGWGGGIKLGTTQYQQYDFLGGSHVIGHNCLFYGGGVAGLNGLCHDINHLLTEREGRTGEYLPEVVAVRTERSSKLFIIWHSVSDSEMHFR